MIFPGFLMCWNLRPTLPTTVKARSAAMHAAIVIRYSAHAVSHALYVLGKTVVHESRKLLSPRLLSLE